MIDASRDTMGKNGPAGGEKARPLVEISDLSFSYPGSNGSKALSDIDLTIHQGEFLGITGPSGGGKSTLAMCLNGLAPEHTRGRLTGEIRLSGESITGKKPAELASRIGMVFQDPDLQLCFPVVREELSFGPGNLCLPREEIAQRVSGVSAELGIHGLLDREVNSLSGGQRQLVSLGAVLTMRPEILVLDEPTAQLDSRHRGMVMDILARLRGGTTVVLISHDTGLLTGCHRIAVLDRGGLQRCSPPHVLFGEKGSAEEFGLETPFVAAVTSTIAREHGLDHEGTRELFGRLLEIQGYGTGGG